MRVRRGRAPGTLLGIFILLLILVVSVGRCGPGTAIEGRDNGALPSATTPNLVPAALPSPTAVALIPTSEPQAPTSGSTMPTPAVADPTSGSAPTSPPAKLTPTEVATVPSATATTAPTKQPATAQPTTENYTVRQGDTLWGISREKGVSVQDLARANGLDPDGQLVVGQRLRIPQPGSRSGIQLPPIRNGLMPPASRPLRELAPAVVRYLESRQGRTGAAVYDPDADVLYVYNGGTAFETASVVKVPIMVTQLTRQQSAGAAARPELMSPMITVSSNEAATALLAQVGGPQAVDNELRARGLKQTRISSEAWGLSTTTASDMSMLLRSIYYGERLNERLRSTAFGLLSGIVAEQRWGVPVGLPRGAPVAFKGGWLPTDQGWLVHQIGVTELDGKTYVFAFLTGQAPTWDYGKVTLRESARILSTQVADK